MEAQAYYSSLETEFNNLAHPTVDPKTQALLNAARPYYDAEMRLQALVKHYNDEAVNAVMQAQRLAGSARRMATKAVHEQQGFQPMMAERHMLQAHSAIISAEERRGLARNIKQLAENMNAAVPGYQQATQMAIDHTLATFPG